MSSETGQSADQLFGHTLQKEMLIAQKKCRKEKKIHSSSMIQDQLKL